MTNILLKVLRFTNKLMSASQSERIYTERLVKSKYVYEFREI